MKMKFKKICALILLCLPLSSVNNYWAKSYSDEEIITGKSVSSSESYNEVRKVSFGNNIESVIKLKYYPEVIKSTNEDGSCMYGRYVTAVETLYVNKDGLLPAKLLEHKVKVHFTYDKKSIVKIENREEDIDCSKERLDKGNKRWKLAQTYEILYDKGICIVSEMCTLFKQQKLTEKIRLVECFHIDIIGTCQGVVAINSKSI